MENEFIKTITLNKRISQKFWNSELEIAINDLQNRNNFSLIECGKGPYIAEMSIIDGRVVLNVNSEKTEKKISIPTRPFKTVIKDYFLVFDSYQDALNNGHHSKLQAIDMGRRGLHDEGADILIELLSNKIKTDHETARRLFTIMIALHLK